MPGIPQDIAIWIITTLTGSLFVLGVPIFLCVAFWATLTSLAVGFTIQNIGITSYQGIESYALLAMPLFILTGDLIGAGGIAKKLSIMARRFLAPLRGGLSLGFVTPPFGLDLFVASGITGIPYDKLIRWVPPYLIGIILAWLVVAAVPWLSLVFI